MPTKLYLPIVSVVEALSNKNDNLDSNLTKIRPRFLFQKKTDLAEIFRYASVGVKMSAGIVAHKGTRFGGFGRFSELARTCFTVSNEGLILTYFYEINETW